MRDDWRQETHALLRETGLFTALEAKCRQHPAGSHTLALVDDAAYYAFHRSKLVLRHMGEFTLHDGTHLFRVLAHMQRLLPAETLELLSVPELLLLFLSAFFHDIGMAPSDEEVNAWRGIPSTYADSKWYEEENQRFQRFASTYPHIQKDIRRLASDDTKAPQAELLRSYLLSEYIRQTHGERVREVLVADWEGRLLYRDLDIGAEVAALAQSHTEDALSLLELDHALICGPNEAACLPFVGAILRLADILDFDAKRTPQVLFAHLGVRHPVSLVEWQKHRSIQAWRISGERIAFHAKCSHPAIEAAIRGFCDILDEELQRVQMVLSKLHVDEMDPFPTHYKIPLPARVDRSRIGPKVSLRGTPDYSYKDIRFTLSHKSILDLLLGQKLYGSPDIALRELIQNSLDACQTRAALERHWGNPYLPEISIVFEKDEDVTLLRVEDNGIGMDIEVVEKYYTKIGESFYRSQEFYALRAEADIRFAPISRFGIGVLSCFMVADAIVVKSRKLLGPNDSAPSIELRVESPDSIFWMKPGRKQQPGTVTELVLKEGHPWVSKGTDATVSAIKKTIPHPPVKIRAAVYGTAEEWDGTAFDSLGDDLLFGCSWKRDGSSGKSERSYFRVVELGLNDEEVCMAGKCKLWLLFDGNSPASKVTLFKKEVTIAGSDQCHNLAEAVELDINRVRVRTSGIALKDGEIKPSEDWHWECDSVGTICVHGISIPINPFETFRANGPRLEFPFPCQLTVDLYGVNDLDLNSARSDIILTGKWTKFVFELSQRILRRLKDVLEPDVYLAQLRSWHGHCYGLSQEFKDAVSLALQPSSETESSVACITPHARELILAGQKIAAIKEVRSATGLSLLESKKVVENYEQLTQTDD